jgi:hypothetical protein
VVQQITRHSDDFRLHMADQTLNFTPFRRHAAGGGWRYAGGKGRSMFCFPIRRGAGLRAGLMLEIILPAAAAGRLFISRLIHNLIFSCASVIADYSWLNALFLISAAL